MGDEKTETSQNVKQPTSRRAALRQLSKLFGKEKHDPVPVEMENPRPLTLREEMQLYIRQEVSAAAKKNGMPSFQEEDDFDLDDGEPDLTSPYTVHDLAYGEGVEGVNDLNGDPDQGSESKEAQEASQSGEPAEPVPPLADGSEPK